MTNYPRSLPPPEKPSDDNRQTLVRRGEDGGLEFVTTRHAVTDGRKYLDAAFKGVKGKVDLKELFMRAFHRTSCFHCGDTGHQTVRMRAPNGVTYPVGYRCVCAPPGSAGVDSITTLTYQGLFRQHCLLGGEDGSDCQLDAPEPKCGKFNCTKFARNKP